MRKECGKIEGDNVHYNDYFNRFQNEYAKNFKFEAVMYYNDEVF